MPSHVSRNLVVDAPNLDFSSYPTSLTFRGSSAHFFHESERLKTFEGWPLPFMQPEAMSRAGFYYTKRQDIVRCPFCDVEVKNWEEGDDPLEDHRKWKPMCTFITNPAASGNIPLSENHAEITWSNPPSPSDSGYDTCGTRAMRGMDIIKRNPNLENKNTASIYKARAPSFPQFASLEERLKSFTSWPVSLKIKPKVLSDAGFYYTGKGDQTICFYCGGGLKDWEDSDDPWMEHAKWFSKCTFVLLNKGEQFVEEARESIKPSSEGQSGNASKTLHDAEDPVSLSASQVSEEPVAGSSTASSSSSPSNDAMMCKLCYSKGLEVVFLPCGHLMSCIDCSMKLTSCGICRKPIENIIRTFVS